MGEVYRAKDSRLDRDVAIKVLPEHLAKDPEALGRFEREVKAVAALSHPNILAIHNFGSDHGLSFAVTELLEGETLRSRIARSALPWRKALEVGVGIADGLAAAHAKDIIHRDLKPENIFLTSDGQVKILDFGLARVESRPRPLAETATFDPAKTDPGTVMGTVGYMSPEQVRGRPVDARGDIFSLGCVLYETVTGNRPFSGDTAADTMTAVLNHTPPVPAESGVSIPPELDRVLMRCLEKNPNERFQSARDLAFTLRTIVSDSGVSKVSQAVSPPRSRPAVWIAAASVLAVIGILLISFFFSPFGDRGKAIDSLAVLPFAADSETEYLSDGLTESIINSLSKRPGLRVVPRSTVFRYKGQDADHRKVARELNVGAVLTGRLVQRGQNLIIQAELVDTANDAQLWGERYSRTLAEIFAVEEEIAGEIVEALRLRLSRREERIASPKRYTDNPAAYQAYLRGRFWWNKRTEEGFRKAIEFFDDAIQIDSNYALAYAGKADCYSLLGFYFRPPKEVMPKARQAAEAALRIDDALAEAHVSLGGIKMFFDWDWPAAERAFKRAIELNPRYPTAYHWYSVFLLVVGQHQEAVRNIEHARQLDPGSLIINANVGLPYLSSGQIDRAIEQYRSAIEMDPNFVPAHLNLGRALVEKAMYDEAIAEFREVIDLSGPTPHAAGDLGYAYAVAGKREEALQELETLSELSGQHYVSAFAFAMIYTGLGDNDRAFQWLGKAYDDRDANLPFLRVMPAYGSLRSDPRFDELLERMGLAP